MVQINLIDVLKNYVSNSNYKFSFNEFVEKAEEEAKKEWGKRNSLLEKYQGKLVLTKDEVLQAISEAVQNASKDPFSLQTAYLGKDIDMNVFVMFRSLLNLSKYQVIEECKDKSVENKVEYILSASMGKTLPRYFYIQLNSLLDNYATAHSKEEYDEDDEIGEIRSTYNNQVVSTAIQFLGTQQEIQEYVLENQPHRFMSTIYESFEKEIVEDKEYYIFI